MKPFRHLITAFLPLAAFAVLLFVAAQHSLQTPDDAGGPDSVRDVSLLAPDSRVSEAQAILLRSQYRYYLRLSSTHTGAARRQNAIQKYNLSSAECSRGVFEKTHLPHSVK